MLEENSICQIYHPLRNFSWKSNVLLFSLYLLPPPSPYGHEFLLCFRGFLSSFFLFPRAFVSLLRGGGADFSRCYFCYSNVMGKKNSWPCESEALRAQSNAFCPGGSFCASMGCHKTVSASCKGSLTACYSSLHRPAHSRHLLTCPCTGPDLPSPALLHPSLPRHPFLHISLPRPIRTAQVHVDLSKLLSKCRSE